MSAKQDAAVNSCTIHTRCVCPPPRYCVVKTELNVRRRIGDALLSSPEFLTTLQTDQKNRATFHVLLLISSTVVVLIVVVVAVGIFGSAHRSKDHVCCWCVWGKLERHHQHKAASLDFNNLLSNVFLSPNLHNQNTSEVSTKTFLPFPSSFSNTILQNAYEQEYRKISQLLLYKENSKLM